MFMYYKIKKDLKKFKDEKKLKAYIGDTSNKNLLKKF